MEEEKMDNVSTLENDIEEKIRRINDFIVSTIPKEDERFNAGLEDKEFVSKLKLENVELKEQLSALKETHEKDLQNLSAVIKQLRNLMEEADD